MAEIGPVAHAAWYEEHMHSCQKNVDGSSGMMEVEGAKVMWGRSVERNKMRYTTMLSDGDSKAFTELCKLNPYGPDHPITKEDCINHVAKRVGTALRNLVSDNKKRKVTLGGKKSGALTQKTMNKLQSYYAKAIRSNHRSVTDMENAIWGTVFHCCSTDDDPHHQRCQKGKNSWCFYQRAIASEITPPKHEDNIGTSLNIGVFRAIVPVYKKLADPELLKRCTHSKTQNANESLHGVIWSRCPKDNFASRAKVEMATILAVGEFNMGSTASHNFMASQGLTVGRHTKRLGKARDNIRQGNSRLSKEAKQQKRREKIQQAKQKERRLQEKAEGGPAYVPGLC
ncbi:hypothetical protein ACOMHN_015191 [Nucella lapillus]